jgi:hypothetical protein
MDLLLFKLKSEQIKPCTTVCRKADRAQLRRLRPIVHGPKYAKRWSFRFCEEVLERSGTR